MSFYRQTISHSDYTHRWRVARVFVQRNRYEQRKAQSCFYTNEKFGGVGDNQPDPARPDPAGPDPAGPDPVGPDRLGKKRLLITRPHWAP